MSVGKDGKQVAQAQLDLKVAATSGSSVDELMSNIERENTRTGKFYSGTIKTTSGLGGGPGVGSKHREMFTVKTLIYHREPEQYTREDPFTPPKRNWVPAAPTASTATPPTAPMPAEKPAESP